MTMGITLADIEAAAEDVREFTIRTPQRKSPKLSARLGVDVALKLEMLQHSGSFKTRGAFHQMRALGAAALGKGVVAVSGGNFARAVAYCSGVLGVDAIVCMPENAPQGSIDATRAYGACHRAAAGRGRRISPAPTNGCRERAQRAAPIR